MILGKIVGSDEKEDEKKKKKTAGSPRRSEFTLTGMIMEGKKQRKKSE